MDHLQTEARNPASTNLDELTALDIVRLMNAEDAKVIPAIASQAEAIAQAIEVIADRLRAGGRLIYVGAGTSGRLGVLDATECPPTFNSPPEQVVGLIAGGHTALTRAVEGAEDKPELAEQDLQALQFTAKDVLVGIATSGRTPYVLGAIRYARRQAAFTIGLSCNADSELIPEVDLAITPVVGPEVLSGSTRLKAGTATKLVLNMLTTGAMVRLGKTFGNLMVDLRATNTKLRARTNRIVRQLTGATVEHADQLLAACAGELKTALVARLTGLSPEESRSWLSACGGQVREALTEQKPGFSEKPGFSLSATDLILGIDGGGSHTKALLARLHGDGGWTVLGEGVAGPSNPHAVGIANATRALDEAVSAAFTAAGLERVPAAAACLGLAGAGRPDEQVQLRAWAERVHLAENVEVGGDVTLLLAAGTPDGWGVALVAGTGSCAFGRAPDGRTSRAGGWGHLLGDEGSGYALAMAGLRAVVRTADGRELPTFLTERLPAAMNVAALNDLIPLVNQCQWDRAALASLAPIVLDAAAEGDPVAEHLVHEAAHGLAGMVATVTRALGLEKCPVPLALAGGVILGHESYRRRVIDALPTLGLHANPVALIHEPAEGALRICTRLPAQSASDGKGLTVARVL